jgi:hypothetical protein
METDGAIVVVPHKVRAIAIPTAAVIFVVFVVVAVLLRSGSTGVEFGAADQVSIVLIGAALAAAVLLAVRPRVRADADGVEVRNVLFGQRIPWATVVAVTFPDGAPWARLELPQDEYVPVVAVQAWDGERAVAAMRELRALHRAAQELR